ncbi:MAG: hypothetical protein F7B20_01105 [Aeropyrum sp.]|nr:hypothetical protein [Aeropyrum sp.]
MSNSDSASPIELPSVEFRKILLSEYYSSLENPTKIMTIIAESIDNMLSLGAKLKDSILLRMIFEMSSGISYELRLYMSYPSERYFVIYNIDRSFDFSNIYSIFYEIFLVSNEIIETEIMKLKSLKVAPIEIKHRDELFRVVDDIVKSPGYPLNIAEFSEEVPKPKDYSAEIQLLNLCMEKAKESPKSYTPFEAILKAIEEGFGVYEDLSGQVHCILNTEAVSTIGFKEDYSCKYLLIVYDSSSKTVREKMCKESASEYLEHYT